MGNPAGPEMTEYGLLFPKDSAWGIEVAVQQNWSFDRPMKLAEEAEPDERTRLNNFSYNNQFGVLSVNMADRVTVFAGFGTLEIDMSRRPLPGNEVSYRSGRDFAWTVGGQAVLFFVDNISCGVSANYMTTDPNVKSLTQNGASLSTSGARLHYTEWQVGLGVSGKFSYFLPYIGAAFASADLRVTNPFDMTPLELQVRHENFKSYDRGTLVLGLGFSNETVFSANIEGRLIGETALSLAFSLRF
ncbi:MAG: hypothetical protein P0S94_01755 [Simkaniaceae bacterium]|nr:hypothetical protein [Simkaniaceae bacterium]